MSTDAKRRLGRGLSSLISVDLPPPGDTQRPPAETHSPVVLGQPALVDLDQIRPNPHQPRKHFGEAELKELADSIKAQGIIQPLVVAPREGGYELIAGERRLRAARQAGLTQVPVIIRDADELAQAQLALIENIQRSDLNPIERAKGYQTLIDEMGLTQLELAQKLGEDRSSITNHLRLLDLAPDVQALVDEGQLSFGHAKLLAGLPDLDKQIALAYRVLSAGLSVRALARLVAHGGRPLEIPQPMSPVGPGPREAVRTAHIIDVEKRMSRTLGLRVQVKPARGKATRGRLVLHYANLDQFDEIAAKLGVQLDE